MAAVPSLLRRNRLRRRLAKIPERKREVIHPDTKRTSPVTIFRTVIGLSLIEATSKFQTRLA